jgi:hypothetical protein
VYPKVAAVLALITLAASGLACGAPAEESSESAGESAFTVSSGDRFVVSATQTEVVLRKRVDGVTFPFDEKSLAGKAILIHPLSARAETGVYARVRSIVSTDDRYVITSEPLSLSEMEDITEDEIVRIYISSNDGRLSPKVALGLHPLAGADGDPPPPMEGFAPHLFQGLERPEKIGLGVTFANKIKHAAFDPDVLVEYKKETGLELGMRASLDWQSKVTLGGRVGGEFFRSASIKTPAYIVLVPIGPAVVPVSLTAEAYITCSAFVTGPAAVDLDIDVSAQLGGSMRVKKTNRLPNDWVKPGRWEPQADGSASVKPDLRSAPMIGSVACALPRIQLKAFVAGVAGPYIAIQPTASVTPDELAFSATLSVGVEAQLFKRTVGTELVLKTWKPVSVRR